MATAVTPGGRLLMQPPTTQLRVLPKAASCAISSVFSRCVMMNVVRPFKKSRKPSCRIASLSASY